MTSDELIAIFERHEDEFLKFTHKEGMPTNRPDLMAFITLDRLVPSEDGMDIVAAAEHDEIYLDTSIEDLAAAASEDDVVLLIQCGVRFDAGLDCLAMFV